MNSHAYIVHTDGGARGNPGPAGIGYTIHSPDKALLAEHGEKIGTATNNEAEYKAMIQALRACTEFSEIKELTIYSDSELMVSQLTGKYKVSSPTIKEFFGIVKQLESKFHKVSYIHVRRNLNKRADELVNAALDGKAISTLTKTLHTEEKTNSLPESLPKNANLMFHGKHIDVYQWQQELFNKDYTIFEKSIHKDCVCVITTTKEGKILLTHEEQPYLGAYINIPGGRCEQNESAEETATRELQEETGYTSDDITLFYTFSPKGDIEYTCSIFLARNATKKADPILDPGEKITVLEVSFEEFVAALHTENFRNFPVQLCIFKHLSEEGGQKKLKSLLGLA
ncbi:MAG: reverse transcriptase-like protein [Candidatus Dojkabacteria bacterium]|nr:MAG: reverse transcriptase-like protein [Candidatus Dojkabacteria bacterium]